ncbi:MAG: hypothetical protein ACE5GT_08550, partial [Rhodospirillales bacterium]
KPNGVSPGILYWYNSGFACTTGCLSDQHDRSSERAGLGGFHRNGNAGKNRTAVETRSGS